MIGAPRQETTTGNRWDQSVALCLTAALLFLTLPANVGLAGAPSGEGEFFEVDKISVDERSEFFGDDLAVQGDWLVVGASYGNTIGFRNGSAYVFHREGDVWKPTQRLLPVQPPMTASSIGFGNAVALDGETLVVGATGDFVGDIRPGAVYVYGLDGDQWVPEARFTLDGADSSDHIGSPIALEGDTLAVGGRTYVDIGRTEGSVYVFERRGGVWMQTQRLNGRELFRDSEFGKVVALRGDVMVIGGGPWSYRANGEAYVFRRTNGIWEAKGRLVATGYRTHFGESIAIDGETIYVGAPGASDAPPLLRDIGGCVHVFEPSTGFWEETTILHGSGLQYGNRFGASIAIDGATMLIGTGNVRPNGAVYIYGLRGRAWVEQTILMSSVPLSYPLYPFGWTTAVDGDTLFVSNELSDDNAGALHLFEPAASEVILGLGQQRATARSASELLITVDVRSAEVASFHFSALFPPEVPLGNSAGSHPVDVQCELEDDLRDDFELSGVVEAAEGILSVELSNATFPSKPLPRDGRLGRCHVPIAIEAAAGVWTIPCADGSTAADTEGIGIATRCEEGELTVFPFACTGDCDEDGSVSINELVTGLQIGLGRSPADACDPSDIDRDGTVSVNEIISAVGYAIDGCPEIS